MPGTRPGMTEKINDASRAETALMEIAAGLTPVDPDVWAAGPEMHDQRALHSIDSAIDAANIEIR